MIAHGSALIDADDDRIGAAAALGLDATLLIRRGKWGTEGHQEGCRSVVDVDAGEVRLLAVVEGQSVKRPSEWIEARPQEWRDGILFYVFELSNPHRKVFEDTLVHATQIADPILVVGWPAPTLTSADGASRTGHLAIGGARPIRSIAQCGSWSLPTNAWLHPAKRCCSVS